MAGKAKIISLSSARALRSTLEALHSPESQAVIFEGALHEFRQRISPVIRELLTIKNAAPQFQAELLQALERAYAAHHTNQPQDSYALPILQVAKPKL